MNAATKLGVFGAGLALVFGAAYGFGTLVDAGPGRTALVDTQGERGPGAHGADEMTSGAAGSAGGGHEDGGQAEGGQAEGGHADGDAAGGVAAELPGGLMVSEHGYTLERVSADPTLGQSGEFAFRIVGANGRPVTAFDEVHEKRLHLIVVRRDLSGFEHVHPTLGEDGVWRIRLPFPAAGTYRAFADFTPTGGEATTLGIDVPVAGSYQPAALPAPTTVARVDGYTVTMRGRAMAGESSMLTFQVERGGRPVTDLHPYLGSYGHLVALRGGDLAYLHVHPDGSPGDGRTASGPDVGFHVEAPTAGAYRLYLDFQHDGSVHTAEFTVNVPSGA
ncbi:hypothetical protein [Actinopolymorpha pittospori]